MRRLVPAFALALALSGCMGGGCNVPPTPQSDICELPPGQARPTVSSVEIGQRLSGSFVPIADGSVVQLVTGGQGSDMVVASLRIAGSGLSSCIAQVTVLEETDGNLITSENAPMSATMAGPDTFVTGDILLPYYGPYGGFVRIRADVGGTNASVQFWAGAMGTIDASTVFDAAPDAAPDAMPTDAPPGA